MPDLAEQLAEGIKKALGIGEPAIPSAAPGGGPTAEREGGAARRPPLGHLVDYPGHGGDWRGFGGHGDPVVVDTHAEEDVRNEIAQLIAATRASRPREPKPSGRVRFNQPFSIEARIKHNWYVVLGPWSFFNGTVGAPNAGNSTQQVTIALPATANSPVLLLNRYPGAMYMSLYLKGFSWVPTAATGTGRQELWFSDIGGATVGLGVWDPSNTTAGSNQKAECLLSSQITDPGNATLGVLNVNNIGIGGTPTSVRYQLNIGYVAMLPDPYFNEQMAVGPTPADIAEALRSLEA